MRVSVLAALAAAACTTATTAQKPGETSPGPMPILGAADMITVCLNEVPDPLEARTRCIGRYDRACMEHRPDGDSTAGMMRCVSEEYEAWQARLDARVAELDVALNRDVQPDFAATHAAWQTWRDTACAFEARLQGAGTMAPLINAACYQTLTAEWAIQLEFMPEILIEN